MDLKGKLAIHRLKNKFENFPEVDLIKISSINEELRENEKIIINEVSSSPIDKIKLEPNNLSKYIFWSLERILPHIRNGQEIIILDSYHLIFILLKDVEKFLKHYLETSESFGISLLNRDQEKYLEIFTSEDSIEFFERNLNF